MIEGLLVPSTNSGRYAIGDSNSGPDLSGGTVIEVYIAGRWVLGRVEHALSYNGSGCYAISDRGRSHKDTGPQTQEEVQQAINARMRAGLSLQDAIIDMEGRVKDLFCGYYLILEDGIIGLCTGMRVRLDRE